MSKITLTKLYFILSEKVGKETAESLTSYIESKINNEVEYSTRYLASKEDLAQIEREMKRGMIKWFFRLSIILSLLILGLYILMFLK